MTYLLSLDQSITSCGYSIFEIKNNNLKLIKFDTIKLDTRFDYFQRIISLEYILDNLVKEYNIKFSLIEDIQKHRGTGLTTYKKLSSLLFFLQYYFFHKKIEYEIIHVNTWRSTYKEIFGLTEVNKAIVYQHLHKVLGYPPQFDNHMSDSVGMGLSYCHMSLNNLIGRDKK